MAPAVLGELAVLLTADDSIYNQIMAKAKGNFAGTANVMTSLSEGAAAKIGGALTTLGRTITSVGIKFSVAGAAITGPLIAAAKVYASMGDELVNMSLRTGIGVEALSKLSYAAIQSGASIEELSFGFRRYYRTLQEAAKPGGDMARKIFGQLQIPVSQLRLLKPEDQLLAISDAFSKIEDPAKRSAVATELFGYGAMRLIPFLRKGSEEIRTLMAEATRLGLVISSEDAEAAREFDNTLKTLWSSLKIITFTVGQSVAPVLKEMATWIIENMRVVRDWVRNHQDLVKILLKVGFVLTAIGAVLIPIGSIITAVVAAFMVFGWEVIAVVSAIVVGFLEWAAAIGVVAYWLVGKEGLVGAWETAKAYMISFFKTAIGFISNFSYNMKELWRWFKDNWFQILVEIGKMFITVYTNMIYNLGIVLKMMFELWLAFKTWLTVQFSRLFTMDFVGFVVKGLGKALIAIFDWGLTVAEIIKKALTGELLFDAAGIVIGFFKRNKQVMDDAAKNPDFLDTAKKLILENAKLMRAPLDGYKSALKDMPNLKLDIENAFKEATGEGEQGAPGAGFGTPSWLEKGTFKEMNLNRFTLSSPIAPAGQPIQKVQDFGVMGKLDVLIHTVQTRPTVAQMG